MQHRLGRILGFSAVLLGTAPGLLLGAAGCDSRSVGSAGDAALPQPDSASPRDAGGWRDGGQALLYGTLVYRDERRETALPGLSASFTAAFFEVDYQLSDAVPVDYVETRVTHDNVECAIYFTSPTWGVPPVPPEPEQVDAGEIRLESAFDAEGGFAVTWGGVRYTVDERPNSGALLPGWVVSEGLEALAVFLGSPRLPAGNRRLSLIPSPKITEPSGEGEVQPDANGLFRIAWEEAEGSSAQVRLDMNMDWDDAAFVCHPPEGHSQVLLPQDWLSEYSWGYAELRVTSRQNDRFEHEDADLRLKVRRTDYRSVQFAIVW